MLTELNHEDHTTTRPLSDRVCDVVCVTAAVWTLCCHAVLAAGGSLHDLLLTAGAAAFVVAGGLVWWRQRTRDTRDARVPLQPPPGGFGVTEPGPSASGSAKTVRTPPTTNRPAPAIAACVLGVVSAALTLIIYARTRDTVWLWRGGAFAFAAALVAEFLSGGLPAVPRTARNSRRHESALWVIGAACVVLTLVCHRQDWDDAFYINLAVAACDTPELPLLARDTVHGVAGAGLHFPFYRVHSFELFNGTLAYLTGIPAIYCFHWVSACVVALLVPLGLARLFRLLTPRYWLWGVVVTIGVLVGGGDEYRWYGNYAFVRMWTGKAVYLSFLLPLAYAYGLRFGASPGLRSWLLLAAVQVASVGCTSSALWSVPLATGLAVVSAVSWNRKSLSIVATGALASAYVILIGLAFMGSTGYLADAISTTYSLPRSRLDIALERVLGTGRQELCALAAVLLAWALCRERSARRFAVIVPAAIWLLLLNPHWDKWVSLHLVGPSYWRTLWSVPVPILMALLITAPLQWRGRVATVWPGRLASVAALVAFVALAPRFSTLSRANHNLLASPHLKVRWGGDYKWAKRLHDSVPAGSNVVAPWLIALWLPTFHHHPYPLIARKSHYHQGISSKDGPDELSYRRFMVDAVGAPDALLSVADSTDWSDTDGALALRFRDGLAHYDVRGVCMRRSARLRSLRDVLESSGFVRTGGGHTIDIWVRADSVASNSQGDAQARPHGGGRATLGGT